MSALGRDECPSGPSRGASTTPINAPRAGSRATPVAESKSPSIGRSMDDPALRRVRDPRQLRASRPLRILQGGPMQRAPLRPSLDVGGLRRASPSHNPCMRTVLELVSHPLGAQFRLSVFPGRLVHRFASSFAQQSFIEQLLTVAEHPSDAGADSIRRTSFQLLPFVSSGRPCPQLSPQLRMPRRVASPLLLPHGPFVNVQRHLHEMPHPNNTQRQLLPPDSARQ